jgi:phytoene dehydrogenase-like protein
MCGAGTRPGGGVPGTPGYNWARDTSGREKWRLAFAWQ